MMYPISKIKLDFPILNRKINSNKLIYFDNAASSLKPNYVIEHEMNYYKYEYAAVHRGIHTLSREATNKVEQVRYKVANFINAKQTEEIIFTKGTTESINLVAYSWGRKFLRSGDNIIITEMEHHANIVPWQVLAKEKGLLIRYIPLLPNGTLDLSKLLSLIDDNTRLFAITAASNVLGIINPLKDIINQVKNISNSLVLVDGAQYIMHQKVDVQLLNCDFYVFSGHKMYGPTGIGILYGKKYLLDNMLPWETGGSMIKTVSLVKETTFNQVPWKFEAGSLNTAGIIGLGAAIDYIKSIGLKQISLYEKLLTEYAFNILNNIPNIKIYGSITHNRIGVISFNLGKHHAYDVGSLLDTYGIAVRTGHQCALPIMDYFKINSVCRISLAMYNDYFEIDKLASVLTKINKILI
ncbi:MAG: SufS family cysteine desulfurase [Candidatus Lightella neohaematopini]|nr:SufS family cysteine desulfurase [Candidatus Lightella neohaematopini]MCV2528878.1 SufS family cysteine desulfurase [Candidatus Lightella neohaematopini]